MDRPGRAERGASCRSPTTRSATSVRETAAPTATYNPDYDHTFVFDNDFPALQPDVGHDAIDRGGLIVAKGESGICRVICFSPRHDLTLSRIAVDDLARVVAAWGEQYSALGAMDDINSVQIFENRGAVMGASNPHPHGQIWASSEPAQRNRQGTRRPDRLSRRPRILPALRLSEARAGGRRADRLAERPLHRAGAVLGDLAVRDDDTRRTATSAGSTNLTAAEASALAAALSGLTIRYDNLFETPFPYSMGFHQRPTDGKPHPEWHLHAHFYPPLLRSATVRKFMVGFEMLGSPQRDITAETAAARTPRSVVDPLSRSDGLSGGSRTRQRLTSAIIFADRRPSGATRRRYAAAPSPFAACVII